MNKFEIIEETPEKSQYVTELRAKLSQDYQVVNWLLSQGSSDDGEVIRIRGHHIQFPFLEFFHQNPRERDLVESGTVSTATWSREAQAELAARAAETYLLLLTNTQRAVAYLEDIFGREQEGVKSALIGWSTLFFKLMNAPSDIQVQLTVGQDNICRVCAIGEHCQIEDLSGKIFDGLIIDSLVSFTDKECVVDETFSTNNWIDVEHLPAEVSLSLAGFRRALAKWSQSMAGHKLL